MAIVYKHYRPDTNQLFYIGIGKNEDRAYSTANRNEKWYSIVDECGFNVEIIYKDISKEKASEIEKKLISEYGRVGIEEDGILVNIHSGGYGGWDHIDSSGENNPMFGISVRDIFVEKYGYDLGNRLYDESRMEAGRKTSKKLKGVKKTEEHKKNLSLSKLDFYENETPEEKEKRREYISQYMRNANIQRSDEYKKKMSETIKSVSHKIHKKVQCEHCGKEMNPTNLKRWHGDNCKLKK